VGQRRRTTASKRPMAGLRPPIISGRRPQIAAGGGLAARPGRQVRRRV